MESENKNLRDLKLELKRSGDEKNQLETKMEALLSKHNELEKEHAASLATLAQCETAQTEISRLKNVNLELEAKNYQQLQNLSLMQQKCAEQEKKLAECARKNEEIIRCIEKLRKKCDDDDNDVSNECFDSDSGEDSIISEPGSGITPGSGRKRKKSIDETGLNVVNVLGKNKKAKTSEQLQTIAEMVRVGDLTPAAQNVWKMHKGFYTAGGRLLIFPELTKQVCKPTADKWICFICDVRIKQGVDNMHKHFRKQHQKLAYVTTVSIKDYLIKNGLATTTVIFKNININFLQRCV